MKPQEPESGSESGPEAEPEAESLSPEQLHSLFDILTHSETYREVESFKFPGTIARYGHPFAETSGCDGSDPEYASESATPLLAALLATVILPLPGVRDLPLQFWNARLQGVLAKFAEAGLSESYDKGALSTRKTLATAASAIHETVTRGILGGYPRGEKRDLHRNYDPSKASDLIAAWDDVLHEAVYGDLTDELFNCATEKSSLEDHSPAVRTAVEYIIIHVATLMHHIFVLSPEGQYLLKLVENVHKLLPYYMIKQTLRIGNAATMVGGMIRLLLAKVTVGALSNWVGLTQNADDGMNLLQRVISMVLSWDTSEFHRSADKIEKMKGGPSRDHLSAIRQYVDMPKDDHDALRVVSMETRQTIIVAIFQKLNPGLLTSLTEAQHAQCLEFYSALLSIRDREQITRVLCRQIPDLFTESLRDCVDSFEPMIRTVHERVDLREHLSAVEAFLTELIATSKPKKRQAADKGAEPSDTAPSVEDYIRLLRRNKQLLYNWLHACAANCPEITDSFRLWAQETAKKAFRQRQSGSSLSKADTGGPPRTGQRSNGAGDMSPSLQRIFAEVPAGAQRVIVRTLDAHTAYLDSLQDLSTRRMQRLLDNLKDTADEEMVPKQSLGILSFWSAPEISTPKQTPKASTSNAQTRSMCGPGMFLSRWQVLLDDTTITPATIGGPLRSGRDVKGSSAQGKVGVSGQKDAWNSDLLVQKADAEVPQPPKADTVINALGEAFKLLVVDTVRNLQEPCASNFGKGFKHPE